MSRVNLPVFGWWLRLPAPLKMFLFALAIHLAGIWSLPLIDRDEPRFAEAAREMRERGDWVVPWLNNRERFDKPPLIYWLQIVCYSVFGESDVAARLPSAVLGAGVAAILVVFARRFAVETSRALPAEKIGWWSGTIFTLALQTIIHAKAAVADMAMIFFVTIAIWCAWECGAALKRARGLSTGEHKSPGSAQSWLAWALGCHAALGLGFLAKGPIALLPLLLLFCFAAHAGANLRQSVFVGAGFLLCLGIVAAWGIPALQRTRGEFFEVGIGKHVVERGLVAQEGHGSENLIQYIAYLPYFFVLSFFSFFPWAFQLPGLIVRAWRNGFGGREGAERVFWAYVGLVFLIFTLYKTKLPHYTLPAFPILALLFAYRWFGEGRDERFLRNCARGMIVFVAVFAVLGRPIIGQQFLSHRLNAIIQEYAREDTQLGSVSYKEPSLVWSLRARSRGWHHSLKPKDVAKFLGKRGHKILITPEQTTAEAAIDLEAASSWPVLKVEGLNPARARWEKLEVRIEP